METGASAGVRYRPDIDGLRAVAIIPVVAYHVGVRGFSGGFVGVDVFFVISGFLITGLLAAEHQRSGSIDILEFYARRVRRLLPALSLVMLALLAAAPFLLTPAGEQQRLAQSVMSTAGFVSNLYFWRIRSNYFAPEVDVLPLLHTWTLAVEEQFYIAWPLVMIAVLAIARRLRWPGRGALLAVLVVGTLASFALSQQSIRVAQAASFFLTPFRAWELGVGAVLALVLPAAGLNRALGALLSTAGLIAIAAAVVLIDADTVFPGLAVTAPVLGAAAIIAGGTLSPSGPVTRLLGLKPLTAIGKVSYGWYLWHWPLLALARVVSGRHDLVRDAGLGLLSLGLAVLTYVLVERPIRERRWRPFSTTRSSLLAGAALLIACIALAGALWASAERASGPGTRYAAMKAAKDTDFGALQACHHTLSLSFALPPVDACKLGAPPPAPAVLLWGDSIAQQLIPPLDEAGKRGGVTVIARTASGCRASRSKPLASLAGRDRTADCLRFNDAVAAELATLKAQHGLKGVMLAGSWSHDGGLDEADIGRLVQLITGEGLKVLIVAETQRNELMNPECLARRGETGCALSRAGVRAERAPAMAILGRLAAANPMVRVFDPMDIVCETDRCPLVKDGVIQFRDESHLSRAGSMRLAEPLGPGLAWAAGVSP